VLPTHIGTASTTALEWVKIFL